MKKFFRRLFKGGIFLLIGLLGVLLAKTITFTSRQIPIEAVETYPVPKGANERFQSILKYPTISNAGSIDTAAFLALVEFIETDYPLMDSLLNKIDVGPFNKVWKWAGSNPKLAPVLLISHLDVVPVEPVTMDEWTHPPFSGTFNEGYFWGRGALDIKNTASCIMESVEQLLKENYSPSRTLYIAFGHDEETGGENGAKATAQYFAENDIGFEFILDEGFYVVENALNGLSEPLALIGIAEKGYTTLTLTATLPNGGHSSMPPTETAVGLLSDALKKLEKYPFPAKIDGATRGLFESAGPEMSFPYRMLFANLWLTRGLIKQSLSSDPATNAVIRTTIAPTMLRAGIKDNVLPTRASAKINFRILPGETVSSVIDYVRKTVNDKRVIVSAGNPEFSFDPSPVSTTESFGYNTVQKSIMEVFPDVVVAPSLALVSTDSKSFQHLCDNIYRFAPAQVDRAEIKSVHGTNERISEKNLHNGIRFYRQLILNSCK